MGAFNPITSLLTLVMVVVYIGLTFWLTIRLRSKTSKEFMVGGRAMPAHFMPDLPGADLTEV